MSTKKKGNKRNSDAPVRRSKRQRKTVQKFEATEWKPKPRLRGWKRDEKPARFPATSYSPEDREEVELYLGSEYAENPEKLVGIAISLDRDMRPRGTITKVRSTEKTGECTHVYVAGVLCRLKQPLNSELIMSLDPTYYIDERIKFPETAEDVQKVLVEELNWKNEASPVALIVGEFTPKVLRLPVLIYNHNWNPNGRSKLTFNTEETTTNRLVCEDEIFVRADRYTLEYEINRIYRTSNAKYKLHLKEYQLTETHPRPDSYIHDRDARGHAWLKESRTYYYRITNSMGTKYWPGNIFVCIKDFECVTKEVELEPEASTINTLSGKVKFLERFIVKKRLENGVLVRKWDYYARYEGRDDNLSKDCIMFFPNRQLKNLQELYTFKERYKRQPVRDIFIVPGRTKIVKYLNVKCLKQVNEEKISFIDKTMQEKAKYQHDWRTLS